MTGKEIRNSYQRTKNLLAAIDNTLTMLEYASETTLQTIKNHVGWIGRTREDNFSIPLGFLVQTVSTICKIDDLDRIQKCVYKGKYDGLYKIGILRNGIKNNGYVVTHGIRLMTSKDLMDMLK